MAEVGTSPQSDPPGCPTVEYDLVFSQGMAFHRAGLLPEAEQFYQRVLEAEPRHFDSMHLLGVIHYQRGDYAEAIRLIDAALRIKPDVADAYNNRANALKKLGRFEEALASYNQAIAFSPGDAATFSNRGSVFKDLRRFEEAAADFNQAIALKPDFAEAFNNCGNALLGLQRFEEALANYDRAVALKPDNADAFNNRGNALKELGHLEAALASYDRAIALKPSFAEAFFNRGIVLAQLFRLEDALASYDGAIALKPDHINAFNNRGIVLAQLQRFEEALASYDQATTLNPMDADTLNNCANTLKDLGRYEEALANYDMAIALAPDHAEYLSNRGILLAHLERFDEALSCYNRAIALKPDFNYLMGLRFQAKMHVCDWADFDDTCARLHEAVNRGATALYPFQLLLCASSAQEQLRCARTQVGAQGVTFPPLWQGERYSHQRIRVAYVSSDMREHAVAFLTAGLFERHDRTRFETLAISLGPEAPSPMRERLKASFDRFIDAQGISDWLVARLIRESEVDVVVDLNGFTQGSRSNIFAHGPAPVQVNYLGYAGTLGGSHWDYIIADRIVIPEEARGDFAEQVVYLPETFMVTDRARKISERAPSRQEVGLPERGLVFCCFNNSLKITPNVFDIWMRLLLAVEGSVLWLSASNASAPSNLRREAEKRGVSADRLIFAPKTDSSEDYLARQQLADLFLDTLPYNAHATASDALWAGLPVLTCSGATFASRVAGSLLTAVGLPELITSSLEEYEARALTLARDPAQLAALRQKLAINRTTYPLFDTERFTRHIEAAYTTMWERSRRGEPPQSFAVAARDQGQHGA